jgi:hypothetical protein
MDGLLIYLFFGLPIVVFMSWLYSEVKTKGKIVRITLGVISILIGSYYAVGNITKPKIARIIFYEHVIKEIARGVDQNDMSKIREALKKFD